MTMCEYFLGTRPHFGLWKKLFMVKAHKGHGDLFICNGAGIQLKPKDKYFKLAPRDTVRKWQQNWFYCADVPPYTVHRRTSKKLLGRKADCR